MPEPDIFDQVAAQAPPPPQGDIFDQVAAQSRPRGDIFDQVAAAQQPPTRAAMEAAAPGVPAPPLPAALKPGARSVADDAATFRSGKNYGDLLDDSDVSDSAPSKMLRGLAKAALNVTSPVPVMQTAGTIAGATALHVVAPPVAAALDAYFAYQMAKGGSESAVEAYKRYQAGDLQGAAEAAGYTGVNALLLGLAAHGAGREIDARLGRQNTQAADSVARETLGNIQQGGPHPSVEDFGKGTYIDALEEQPSVPAGKPAPKPQEPAAPVAQPAPAPAAPKGDVFDEVAAKAHAEAPGEERNWFDLLAEGRGKQETIPHDDDRQHATEPVGTGQQPRPGALPTEHGGQIDRSARGPAVEPAGTESVDRVVARPAAQPEEPQPAAVDDTGRRPQQAPEPATAPDVERVAPSINPAPPGLQGRAGTTYTASGTKVPFRYEVVNLPDVRTSFDPGFDQSLQPRDTERAASQARIDDTAANMNPALMADSPIAADGAPILGPDTNDAETRNHGIESLRKIYRAIPDKAEAYKSHLAGRAEEFGLDPRAVAAVPEPVLVRRRTNQLTPEARQQFVQEANGSSAARMSPSEQANVDKTKLSGELMGLFRPSESGEIKTAGNREFVRRFLGEVAGTADAGGLQLPNGELNQAGVGRIKNAIFAKAYGDSSIVERLAESTDNNIQTITSALLAAAPKFATLQAQAESGDRFDPGIATHLAKAGETLSALRERGTSLEHHLAQHELAGQETPPVTRQWLEVFRDHGKSGARLGQILGGYADAIDGFGSPKQETMFGPAAAPVPAAVLHGTVKELETKWADERAAKLKAESAVKSAAVRPVERLGSTDANAPAEAPRVPDAARPGAAANRREPALRPGGAAPAGGAREAAPDQRPGAVKPAAKRKVTDALRSEEGGVHLDEFAEALKRALPAAMRSEAAGDLAEPKQELSKTGALKDRFVRNLSQLEPFAKPHAAAVRAATSASQSAALLHAAVPAVVKVLAKGNGPDFTTFREMLIESRLRGIKQRWARLATDVAKGTDANLKGAMEAGHLTNLLAAMGSKRDAAASVLSTAAAHAADEDWPGLRDYLGQTFRDARDSVATAIDPELYDKWKQHPGFRAGLAAYKKLIEAPMATSHALNDGVFSDALGPLDAYYPLIPIRDELQGSKQGVPAPFVKPANRDNDFATGLAAAYDLDMNKLRERLDRSLRANNRAALLDTLAGHGLIEAIQPGELAPRTMRIAGEDFAASVIQTKAVRRVMQDGKPTTLGAEAAVIPDWLKRELTPILDPQHPPPPGAVKRLIGAINAFTLAGPTDLVYHASNLVGTMVANTPFLGSSIKKPGVALANLPFTKLVTAVVKILATDPSSESAAADLQTMAGLGLIPERFASVTYSKRFAENTGAAQSRSLAPLLYGPKGLDVRARLALYRVAKSINPKLEPLQAYHFVNQLGNYTAALQGSVERATKGSGLAPFYTAGSTMLRNGLNAVAGTSPTPRPGWDMRLAGYMGLAGALALWALANRAYRGKWPWEEKNSKLLSIAVNDADRNTPLGRALWGTKKGTAYVDFALSNPILSRGLSALGAKDAYETHQLGGSGGQQLEGALKGAANGFLHPFTGGPLVRAGSILATGNSPYITSVHPLTFMPATNKTKPGLPMVGERLKEAGLSLNPFVQKIFAAMGIGHEASKADQGNRALRMGADIVTPRLVGAVTDQNRKAAYLRAARNREK